MKDCDKSLQALAQKNGLAYTRYSDDLSFSTKDKSFDRTQSRKFVCDVYSVLSRSGFRPNLRKTTIVPPGSRKIVLGLNVETEHPRLTKNARDRIRQHLHFLKKVAPVEHAFNREFDSVWGLKAHLRGLIDFANMIEPDFAAASLKEFHSVEWPV
jgi:RNA-directed DNA polymerase